MYDDVLDQIRDTGDRIRSMRVKEMREVCQELQDLKERVERLEAAYKEQKERIEKLEAVVKIVEMAMRSDPLNRLRTVFVPIEKDEGTFDVTF